MIYLDNHATTRCDPLVVEAMLPWWSEHFGNPHSDSHEFGRHAASGIQSAVETMAGVLGIPAENLVITSGATESNLLAIRGFCTHPRQRRRTIITVATEHPAVLDVVNELVAEGFTAIHIPVDSMGRIDMDAYRSALSDDVALVSVMWANNEMGAIAPMQQLARLAHERGAVIHSDATQAVGRMAIDGQSEDVDLISGSAHKFYGPKGVGFLSVGNGNRRVRLKPIQIGGGQQRRRRGGTVNPAGVVGMATALSWCDHLAEERQRIAGLRDELWSRLHTSINHLALNGPPLSSDMRLAGNLNIQLPDLEGEAWMSATPQVAFSSGSACSSVDPTPSHVLIAMGLSESEARRSVRFGVGRFNTSEEIEEAASLLVDSYHRLTQ